MMDFELAESGRLIVITMSGLISEADIDSCDERIAAVFQTETVRDVMLDWEHLEGWEKGAKSAGTWYGMRHWATVRRVAVLAEEKWADEKMRIADIYKAAQVEQFAPKDRDRALAWLKEE